ncbi:hypothetical protein ROLI_046740 (plasmid) [Roseobacter fucihabitans]|uniref:Uncharacterized protein n=1 Tax=Roseobacter fucihabitans TaxID=1537242 RepID=A0ABZ2C0A5_9RHOB
MSIKALGSLSWWTGTWRFSEPMSLSYLQSSIDRLDDAKRDDVIEICINPDGS